MNIRQRRFVEIPPRYTVWTLDVDARRYAICRYREDRHTYAVDHYHVTRVKQDVSEDDAFWVGLFEYLGVSVDPQETRDVSRSGLSKSFDDGLHALFNQVTVFNDV